MYARAFSTFQKNALNEMKNGNEMKLGFVSPPLLRCCRQRCCLRGCRALLVNFLTANCLHTCSKFTAMCRIGCGCGEREDAGDIMFSF